MSHKALLFLFTDHLYKGGTQKWNLFIKVVYLFLRLNFSHLQSPLHLMQYNYWDFFSTDQNSFWTHWFWCFLVLLPFFVYLFHIGKMFPFGDFFKQGDKNKAARGEIRWIWKVGHWGHAVLDQKLLNSQHGVGRFTCKSAIMKWAKELKESSKKFTEAKCSLSQQCQLVPWYRCVPRTLTKWGKHVV